MSDSEADKLEEYLAEKARQELEEEQKSEPLSEYDACVLRESDRVRELVARAQSKSEDSGLNK